MWFGPPGQFGSTDVLVMVMDEGIQRSWSAAQWAHPCYDPAVNDHPDLPIDPAHDLWIDTTGFTWTCGGRPTNQCDNHGTAVAGVVRAAMGGSTPVGGAGLAPNVALASAKIFGVAGQNPTSCTFYQYPPEAVIDALVWAQNQELASGARVVTNLSANRHVPNATMDMWICDTSREHGFVHFMSAGPNNGGDITYPADAPCVNAVTNLTWEGSTPQLRASSNRGPEADFTAPGTQIVTTDRSGTAGYCAGSSGDCLSSDYIRAIGTSFSSPMAAGVAALVLSEIPTLSAQAVETILRNSARDLGPVGHDDDFGWGLPRVDAAVVLAADAIFYDGFETGTPECWTVGECI